MTYIAELQFVSSSITSADVNNQTIGIVYGFGVLIFLFLVVLTFIFIHKK